MSGICLQLGGKISHDMFNTSTQLHFDALKGMIADLQMQDGSNQTSNLNDNVSLIPIIGIEGLVESYGFSTHLL